MPGDLVPASHTNMTRPTGNGDSPYTSTEQRINVVVMPGGSLINLQQNNYYTGEPTKKSPLREITTGEGVFLSVFPKPRLRLSFYFLRKIPFLLSFVEKNFPLAVHYYVVVDGVDKNGDECTGKVVAYSVEKNTYQILSSAETCCLFLFFPIYFFQNNGTLIQVFALFFVFVPLVPLLS